MWKFIIPIFCQTPIDHYTIWTLSLVFLHKLYKDFAISFFCPFPTELIQKQVYGLQCASICCAICQSILRHVSIVFDEFACGALHMVLQQSISGKTVHHKLFQILLNRQIKRETRIPWENFECFVTYKLKVHLGRIFNTIQYKSLLCTRLGDVHKSFEF